jgi:hypothetical protein
MPEPLKSHAGDRRDHRKKECANKPLGLLAAFASEPTALQICVQELGKASAKHLTVAPALGRWCLFRWGLFL